MKKLLGFALAMVLMIGISSTATAQEGEFTIGAGLTLGSEIGGDFTSDPGITLQAMYGITNEIRAGAGLTYYMVGEDITATEINIDGHYFFMNDGDMALYGLAGISFASMSMDFGGGSVSNNDTGINLGGGIEYNLGAVNLFAEPKLTINGFDQFVLTGGVRFGL